MSKNVFDLSEKDSAIKKVAISYHGAAQFGRNCFFCDCYEELIIQNEIV
jgi:hypothetical protein